MRKSQVKSFLRRLYPNIPAVKRSLAKMRIKRFQGFCIGQDEVQEGENNPAQKKQIVQRNLKAHNYELKLTLKMIDRLFENALEYQNCDNLDEIRTDMLFCRLAYGFQPDEYLCFELGSKMPHERKEFISDVERLCFVYCMNDVKDIQLLSDKYLTYKMLRRYFHREAICIQKAEDYPAFQSFVKAHPTFVKKAVNESMGRSVELVDIDRSGMQEREVFDEIIVHGRHILEERVVQSRSLAALNESSVNTIRCITLLTKHGAKVAYCFMKVGRDGSFVDNGGAGGILVGIDKNNGVLNTDGFDEFNNRYANHPNSKIQFVGYQLPEWEQMISICKEMAEQLPSLRYIGWDMAHTADGWVVIEANGMSQLIGPQIVWKRGIKSEFNHMIEDVETIV